MGIEIDEAAIPVAEPVAAACELLGLDPLYAANEGRLVAFVPAASAERVLKAMQGYPGKRGQFQFVRSSPAGRSGKLDLSPFSLGRLASASSPARTPARSSCAAVLAAGGSSICSPASKCRGSADLIRFGQRVLDAEQAICRAGEEIFGPQQRTLGRLGRRRQSAASQ